jgi:hypothetical protein
VRGEAGSVVSTGATLSGDTQPWGLNLFTLSWALCALSELMSVQAEASAGMGAPGVPRSLEPRQCGGQPFFCQRTLLSAALGSTGLS